MNKNIYLHEWKHLYPIRKVLYFIQVMIFFGFGILEGIFTIAEPPNSFVMLFVNIFLMMSSIALGIVTLKPMLCFVVEPFHVVPVTARYIKSRKINALLNDETFIYNDDYEDTESHDFLSFSDKWMYVNGYFIPYNSIAIMALTYESRRNNGRTYYIYYLYLTYINGKSTKIKLRRMSKYIGQTEPYFFTDDSFIEYFIKQVNKNTNIKGINIVTPHYSMKEYKKLIKPILCELNKYKITIEDIMCPYTQREKIERILEDIAKKEKHRYSISEWSEYIEQADKPHRLLSNSVLLSDGSTKPYDSCSAKELCEICDALNISIYPNKRKDVEFMLKTIYASYEKGKLMNRKKRTEDILWLILVLIISVMVCILRIIF